MATFLRPGDVVERVAAIRKQIHDPDVAHGMEDTLYEEILRAIANGTIIGARECACAALMTQKMDFPRWTA